MDNYPSSVPADKLSDKLTDPRWFGPGKWDTIHSLAADAIDDRRKEFFLYFIHHLTSNLKCSVCRGHAMEYVLSNPPEDFLDLQDDSGREIGLFKWSWIFHNTVNRRLGKQEIDWPSVYRIYLADPQGNKHICIRNCGETIEKEDGSLYEPPLPNPPSPRNRVLGTIRQEETTYPMSFRNDHPSSSLLKSLNLSNSNLPQNINRSTDNNVNLSSRKNNSFVYINNKSYRTPTNFNKIHY